MRNYKLILFFIGLIILIYGMSAAINEKDFWTCICYFVGIFFYAILYLTFDCKQIYNTKK